jgi:hypothetical protein
VGKQYQQARLDLEEDIVTEEIETPVTELEDSLAKLLVIFRLMVFPLLVL